MMKYSYFAIPLYCVGLWGMYALGVITNFYVPLGFTASFILMDFMGMFNREKGLIRTQVEGQNTKSSIPKSLEDIAKTDPDAAVITTADEKGNVSKIIIMSDGTIYKQGNPDQRLVDAAFLLQSSVKQFGAEAVAKEIARQSEMYQNGTIDENDENK